MADDVAGRDLRAASKNKPKAFFRLIDRLLGELT